MTFSVSGTTITQSGTDTSLAGLNGLAGITRTAYGRMTVYEMAANYNLVINGTLSFNTGTTFEKLIIKPTTFTVNTIKINGTVTIGTNQNSALHRVNNFMPSIEQLSAYGGNLDTPSSEGYSTDGAGTSPNMSTLYVASGGALYCYGNIITIRGSIAVSASASAFQLVDGYMGCEYNAYIYKAGFVIRNSLMSLPYAGLTMVAAPGEVYDYSPVGSISYISLSLSTPAAGSFDVSGVPSLPSSVALIHLGRNDSFANAPIVNFYNLLLGTDYTQDISLGGNRYHKANLYRRCALTAKDASGVAIDGALVRVSGKSGSTIYTSSTDASGITSTINVKIGYWERNGTSGTKTYYSISNNTTDDFAFRVYSYAHTLGLLPNQILKGTGNLSILWTMFADPAVTLSKSVVNSLVSIATLDDFYDAAKNWKVQSANCTYPTTDTLLATPEGSTINLGSMNVVIDATAASAFAVNTTTNTITLKSSTLSSGTKHTTHKTTGLVSFINGAVASCTFTDGTIAFGTPGVLSPLLGAITLRFTVVGTYIMSSAVFNGAVTLTNTSGGSVIVELPAGVSYTNTGPNITIVEPQVYQSITVSGGVAGTRIQGFDLNGRGELFNLVPSSWPYTWIDSTPYSTDIRFRIRAGKVGKLLITQEAGTATLSSPSVGYLLSQTDADIYNSKAIDGSAVTGISIDDGNLIIELSSGTLVSTTRGYKLRVDPWKLFAYASWWETTEEGIRDEVQTVDAPDGGNIRIYSMGLKNTSSPSYTVELYGAYVVDAITGYAADLVDSTGGNFSFAPDHVVVQYIDLAPGSSVITGDVSDIITPLSSLPTLANIEASTVLAKEATVNNLVIPTGEEIAIDVLNAATTFPINANMVQTNNVALQGDGTEQNKFRSALIA